MHSEAVTTDRRHQSSVENMCISTHPRVYFTPHSCKVGVPEAPLTICMPCLDR